MTKVMNAKFAGTCKKCNQPIRPVSADYAGDLIRWFGAGQGVEHMTCPAVQLPAMVQPTAPVVPVLPAAQNVVNFLNKAKTAGLKFPKVRFIAPDGKSEMRLYVAGDRSRFPGTVQVKIGYDWIGRINLDGTATSGIVKFPELVKTLNTITENPAVAAKAYGALCGRCSFCNLKLTDDGSVEVGYGPICASHYGLPHIAKGTKKLTTTVPQRNAGETPAPKVAEVVDGIRVIDTDDDTNLTMAVSAA